MATCWVNYLWQLAKTCFDFFKTSVEAFGGKTATAAPLFLHK
jgi:hypothetical protein